MPDAPSILANDGFDFAQVKEDGSVDVLIAAALGPSPAASEYLTLEVTGIAVSWGFSAPVGTFDAGTGTWTVILAPGENLSTVMTFTPPADSDVDLAGLTATATATDPDSGSSSSASDGFGVRVDAAADAPTITAANDTVNEGAVADVDISAALSDLDGSEQITGYQITGVPAGFSFNQGTDLGGGVWSFTPAQIAGLTLTPDDPDYFGALNLTAKVLSTENPASGGEFDNADNSSQATDTFTLTWTHANEAPSFGIGDGKVTTPVGIFNDHGRSVTLQADGKIVVAGYSLNGSNSDFALVRYNADGSLDTSFDGGGKVTTPVGTHDDVPNSIFVQADGKIVVAGYAYIPHPSLPGSYTSDFALVRYNADGSLDTSFGVGGKVTTDVTGTSFDLGYSAALQADGKIIVAGYSSGGSDDDFALVRYNADGSLDVSFGSGGKVTMPAGTYYVQGSSVAVQADGKIVMAGVTHNGANRDFALLRFNADGSLDTSFGSGGKSTSDLLASEDYARSVVLQADGKIVVAGYSWNGSNYDLALVRFNADGSLDTNFDGDGKVTTDMLAETDVGQSVMIQADGKIVVAGDSWNGSTYDFALVRYNADGSLDTGFGAGGKVTTPVLASHDYGYSVALQADGKIVVAGQSYNGSDHDFAVVRYNADGSLDLTFDAVSTLDGAPAFTEGGAAVVLDADVSIFDAELSAAGSYDGATLTLSRAGGANGEDVFSATGGLAALTEGGALMLDGVSIGAVTQNSGGVLVLTFGADATQARVDAAIRAIAYSNISDGPPASVEIAWTFSDGNAGAQGTGGALTTTGSTTVTVTAVNDAPTALALSATSIAENSPDGTVIGTLSASDPDAGETFTYSILGDPDGKFAIDNGKLTVDGPLDLEQSATHSVTVRATDASGLTFDQVFTINVLDADPETLVGGGGSDHFVGGGGDDTLDGAGGNDTLDGGSGYDVLEGGDGDDILIGGGGDDAMAGGAGDDIYSARQTGDTADESTGSGSDIVYADVDFIMGAGIENLILTGGSDRDATGNSLTNYMFGNYAGNVLDGGAGDDFMAGGDGDDILIGGDGKDAMRGGAGDDIYSVRELGDQVLEIDGSGNDTVYADVGFVMGPGIENLILTGGSDLNGRGNALDNYMFGNPGDNRLDGGAGDDNLVGGQGDDFLVGGAGLDAMRGDAGDDVYSVDHAGDVVGETAGSGHDVVYASVDHRLAFGVETLILAGAALDGTGNGHGNQLFGNGANNRLDGRGGADYLVGFGGEDIFVFQRGEANGDVIGDFAGNGAATGDRIAFGGYSAGAIVSQTSATSWKIEDGGLVEHFVIANGYVLDAGDFYFA